MKRTIRGAISDVLSELNRVNADNRKTKKEVFSRLRKHANWLVARDSDAFRLGRMENIYQEYKCAEVIDTPTIDPCCNLVSGLTIKRTHDPIPQLYEDSRGLIIKGVFSIDRSKEFSKSTLLDYKAKKNNPYGPKTPYYFFHDGYVYGDLPKKINVVGLYKEDISQLNNCDCPKTCTRFIDTIWTVPEYLQAQVIDFVTKELSMSIQIPAQEAINKNENRP